MRSYINKISICKYIEKFNSFMEDKKEEIYDEKTQTFPNCETENCKQQEPIFVITFELDEGNPKQI